MSSERGSGGLGAAIALEQAGVRAVVIERAPQLEEAGFGLVVPANAVTALRALGLHERVAAHGTRVRRAEIRNPRGQLLTLIDYEAFGWETYGILRAELQRAMRDAAPAERLCLATTCIGATEDGRVLLDRADALAADIVVGADGIRSAVRRSLFGTNGCATAATAPGGQESPSGHPHLGVRERSSSVATPPGSTRFRR